MRLPTLLLAMAAAFPLHAQPPVSLAVVNARVWTGDARRPWADAIAVRGDRIAAVGSGAEVRKLAGEGARVIDARGGMVVPGFVDAHVHFVDGGFRLSSVQLRDARTAAAREGSRSPTTFTSSGVTSRKKQVR